MNYSNSGRITHLNTLIDAGMRQARVERSKAFFALFDGLLSSRSPKKHLSEG